VENATVVGNGDVEAAVNIQSGKTTYVIGFMLENYGDNTVHVFHCGLLRSVGFSCSRIKGKGMISVMEPG